MSFTRLSFLVFLGLFWLLWPRLRARRRPRWALLVVASAVFYGWWDWRFLFLLLASGLIDFFAALGMGRWPRHRRALLWLSVAGNLGSLGLFKYGGFLVAQANALGASLGADPGWALSLTLPVGISFYTFQSMSYTLDVYRGELAPTRDPLHFFAYLALFPQLVAGPIVRARELLPQLLGPGRYDASGRYRGLQLIVSGYFKKVVIADNVAPVVNAAFDLSGPEAGALFWWAAAGLFAVQIYCDFSGYTDIARGIARWMGYEFPHNFEHPYVALGVRDFWARWHISLSEWFRDYVYLPLGGSRVGPVRGHLNLWITFLLSGLWHGANWTFVAWGAWHAGLLSLERISGLPAWLGRSAWGRALGVALTLLLVLQSWVIFRAQSVAQAGGILVSMVAGPWVADPLWDYLRPTAAGAVALLVLVELRAFVRVHLGRPGFGAAPAWARPGLLVAGILACVFLRGAGDEFIYFQF